MTMAKRISIGLMILMFAMLIWGCGKDTPTEPVIQPTNNAQGEISTPGNTESKAPGVGRVGETLNNGYYKVTLKEVDRNHIVVEIENTGNKEASYVGPFNFSVIAADSQVYAVGPSEGVKLNIGQKKEFEFTIEPEKTSWAFSEEGSLLVFQACTDVIPAGEKNDLFLPKGKTVGPPIIFDPNLFVPMVIDVEPKGEILNTGTIGINFSSPINEKSINSITMTGGKIVVVMPRYPDGGIVNKSGVIVILQGISTGQQTLDVSMVTDQAGERLSGPTTFKFSVRPDRMTPTILESKPAKGQLDFRPESCKSVYITFSEPMNTGATKITIDPPINGQNQLAIDWQTDINLYSWYGTRVFVPDAVTQIATMQLNQSLAIGTKYTLTIQSEDLAGNRIEDKIVFETYTPDITPPEIADDQCSPKNGAKGIDPAWVNEIVIVFTESMSGVIVESFEPKWAADKAFGKFYGGDRLIFKFIGGGKLGNEMDIIITLSGEDMAGNPLKTTVYRFWTMRMEG